MRYKSKNEKLHYPVLFFHVVALLVCLTLITTYLLSGAYSKFYTSSSGGDSARVAHFSPKFTSAVITVENQLPGFPNIPDNSYLIDFSVQNYTGDKASEVAMKYKIVLKTTGNIPLTFTLLNGEGNPLEEPWDCNGKSGECVYEYDPSRVFGVGTKETAQYKLKIEWPSDSNNAQFSGMTDAVYLSAEFEQID